MARGRDSRWRRSLSRRTGIGLVLIVIGGLLLPSYISSGLRSLLVSGLVFSLVVYGVDIIHGLTRYISLAHVGLFAVSAYTFVGLTIHLEWSFLSAAIGAVVACTLVGAVVAIFVFRTIGFYFAILTFVVSELIRITVTNSSSLTGGHDGLLLSSSQSLLGVSLRSTENLYRLLVIIVALTYILVRMIQQSDFGLKCKSIGENEILAKSLGVELYRTKVRIFIVSTIPTGVAGIFFALHNVAILPAQFDAQAVLATVLALILGGSGHAVGPIVGSLVYVVGPSYLPFSPILGVALLGALLILVIKIGADGIAPGLESTYHRVVPPLVRKIGATASD